MADNNPQGDDLTALQERLAEMERRLSKAEVMLDLAERTGRIGMWRANIATGDGDWSKSMYELYYREPTQGPPGLHSMASFVHPLDAERMQRSMQLMLQSEPGAVPPIAFRTHPALGPIRHLETCATMLDEGWMTGAIVDVSEREGARHQAQVADHRLAQILERMPFVVFSLDRQGLVTSSNRDPDAVGRDYLTFCAAASRAAMEKAHLAAWLTGEVQVVRAEDTSGRWWEARLVAITSPDGEREELLGVSVDITSQRQLEQKLHEAQKLESLGVLAGGIAHDFNNLLVGVIGNAELIMLDTDRSSPDHECLADILTASHRAAELCRQMLAYSGRGRFVVETVDPREVVGEMTSLLHASIAKTAALTFAFDPDTQPVDVDVSQLRQVVMNLIINASDALQGDGGRITVTTGTFEANSDYLQAAYHRPDLAAGTYSYLEVSDTGVGMDQETQSRIFEPFFSSKAVGRGLGLAAVSGIVRGHQGAIRVSSEPGRGTAFKVLLPASRKAATPTGVLTEPLPQRSAVGQVLVVDDEASVRRLARRTLERLGFTVVEAEDGAQALVKFEEHRADIVGVLLDMTMPTMGGEEAFLALRQLNPAIPVLLSSGYSEQESTRQFAVTGFAGFLQKPYRASELQQAILDVIEGHPPPSERA